MLEQILWFLSWPVFIYLTYRVVLIALKKFEKKISYEKEMQK